MSEHKLGTREEWQAARNELAKLEAEQAERNAEITSKRLDLPVGPGREGVRVRHRGRQEDPRRALRRPVAAARLQHHVRPRLHARRLPRLHQPGRRARRLARPPEPPRRDAALLLAGADRAAERLQATDGLAVPLRLHLRLRLPLRLRPRNDRGAGAAGDRGQGDGRQSARLAARVVGPDRGRVKDGLRENPSWIAFARENGTVYHTYTVSAPDPFVAPYFSFLLERAPKAQPAEPRTWRKDEYPD